MTGIRDLEHHHRYDPGLKLANITGLIALALFAALALYLWTHPTYVPPCASNYKARCPRIQARGAFPNLPPPHAAAITPDSR